jgi:hypothetical protein
LPERYKNKRGAMTVNKFNPLHIRTCSVKPDNWTGRIGAVWIIGE